MHASNIMAYKNYSTIYTLRYKASQCDLVSKMEYSVYMSKPVFMQDGSAESKHLHAHAGTR